MKNKNEKPREKCKEMVVPSGRYGSFHTRRCHFMAVKDGYCKMHHPDSVKKREELSKKRFDKKRSETSWYKLKLARTEIEELKTEIVRLKAEVSRLRDIKETN